MPDDLMLSRLALAQGQSLLASHAVVTLLHATFPPGSEVRWVHAGRVCDGRVVDGSGSEWGHRLPVRMTETGRVVYVTAAAILRTAAREGRE